MDPLKKTLNLTICWICLEKESINRMAVNVFNLKDTQGQRQRRNGQHEGWVVSGSQIDRAIEKEKRMGR